MRQFLNTLLLVLLPFVTVGDGLFVLCVGSDDHVKLEIIGESCESHTAPLTDSRSDDVGFEGEFASSLSRGDCTDTGFEISEFHHFRFIPNQFHPQLTNPIHPCDLDDDRARVLPNRFAAVFTETELQTNEFVTSRTVLLI